MKYSASLDNFAKFITIGICVLFTILIYQRIGAIQKLHDTTLIIIQAASVLVMLLVIGGCYLFSPQYYLLTDQDLFIRRFVGDVRISLNDIAYARILNPDEMKGVIRTFGVGGLFGYYGNYYKSSIGKMSFYASKRTNKILITTKEGKNIVITPDDLGLVNSLKIS
jgi:hypothetical protein